MKVTKLNSSIAFLVTMTLGVIFFDMYAGINGKKRGLFNSLRSGLLGDESKPEGVSTKINEISNSVTSLMSRIAKIEENMKKLNTNFEKKLVFPLRSADAKLYSASAENPMSKRQSLFNYHTKEENDNVEPEQNNNMLDLERQLSFMNDMEDSLKAITSGKPSGKYKNERMKKKHSLYSPKRRNSLFKNKSEIQAENIFDSIMKPSKAENHSFTISKDDKQSEVVPENIIQPTNNENDTTALYKGLIQLETDISNSIAPAKNSSNIMLEPKSTKPADYSAENLKQASNKDKEIVSIFTGIIQTEPAAENANTQPKAVGYTANTKDVNTINNPFLTVTPAQAKQEKFEAPTILRETTKIIHVDPSSPLNINDIFPDLAKEDPVVEVKNFDDLSSFKKFTEDTKASVNTEEDGAVDTKYFKMSEILNPSKKHEATDAKKTNLNLNESKKMNVGDNKVDTYEILNESSVPSPKAVFINEQNKIKELTKALESTDAHTSKKETEKRSCEDFPDSEEAFKNGICVYKEKGENSILKAISASEINRKKRSLDLENENNKLTKAQSNNDNNAQKELKLSSDEKFIKDNQIDKNIQPSFKADQNADLSGSYASDANGKAIQVTKPEEDESLIELIGTKLSKKTDERNDVNIQKPTTITPVV